MKIIKYFVLYFIAFSFITCNNDIIVDNTNDEKENLDYNIPNQHEPGWVRVKFADLENQLNTETTRSGEINTGIAEVDEVANMLGATKVERVFNEGGKFKERRMKYGLHLWYDFYVGTEQSLTRSVKSFSELPMVELVELIPVDFQTSIRNRFESNAMAYTEKYASAFFASTRSNAGDGHTFNDPLLKRQWHYYNDGSTTNSTAGADANIFPAWKVTTGHPDVIVAVVDGGIDVNHPDLAQNMWVNKAEVQGNGLDDDDNGYIDDIHGFRWGRSGVGEPTGEIFGMDHGSHCAGTIAAVNNNGVGLAGVAGGNGSPTSGVRLMSCQTYIPDPAYPDDPHGNSKSTSQTPDAFAYAADNGAVIVNCSFSYSGTTLSAAYKAGIDYFVDNAGIDENGNQTGPMKGGLMVASAGNDGEYNLTKYPGSYEKVINVAYSMSNFKKSPSSNYGFMVDVTAPGGATSSSYAPDRVGGIYSTVPMDSKNWDAEQGYSYKSGTSMAAPHVAGIAALVLSAAVENNIPMTWQKLRDIIERSCWSLDEYNPEYIGDLGHGQVDAGFAIQILLAGDNQPINPPQNLKLDSEANSITLSWDVPSDFFDNPITSTEIFYGMSELKDIDFENISGGVKKEVIVNNKKVGEKESRVFSNLTSNSDFYFAIRTIDRQKQVSEIVYIDGKTKSTGDETEPEGPGSNIKEGSFKVFPTTTTDKIYITTPPESINKKVEVELFSSTGYKVLKNEFIGSTENKEISVASLSSGTYTVKITFMNHTEKYTIIKY